jgi:hypothetical protein
MMRKCRPPTEIQPFQTPPQKIPHIRPFFVATSGIQFTSKPPIQVYRDLLHIKTHWLFGKLYLGNHDICLFSRDEGKETLAGQCHKTFGDGT